MESVRDGIVPNVWKISVGTPLPKTSTASADDITPISLLPLPATILERIILYFATPKFLQEYDNDQFGFRAGSSTTCAQQVYTINHFTKSLDPLSVASV